MPQAKLSLLQTLQRGLKTIWQASPNELNLLLILTLLNGASPAVILFLNKVIIDEISHLVTQGIPSDTLNLVQTNPLLVYSVVAWLSLNILNDALDSVTSFLAASYRDRIQGYTQKQILEKIAYFPDIALFETPELLNIVQMAEKGVNRLEKLSFILITSLSGLAIFVPSLLFSLSIAWWIPVILFTLTAPSVYIELKYRKKSWLVEETQASLYRHLNVYKAVLTKENYAKEVRLFNLQDIFLNRWKNLYHEFFHSMQHVRKKGTTLVLFWSLISGLGIALPYLYVIDGVLNRKYTLGDLALYAGLILQVRHSLFILVNNSSDLYDVILGIRPIFQLLEIQPQHQSLPSSAKVIPFCKSNNRDAPPLPTLLREVGGIESVSRSMKIGFDSNELIFENVSFTYPQETRKILKNINLKIQPNEMIAIVGENGSGKTTLTKLLCRFYQPSEGRILLNGQDIQSIDLKEFYSKIAVVIQDYTQFPVTFRENIAFGDWLKLNDDLAIYDVLKKVGLTEKIEQLSQKIETLLGKELEGGTDLSKGQWQRLAIARALIRLASAELFILDEPTASLDPNTEYEIYQILRQIAQVKTTLIISHRLALCKTANRIIVLDRGQIVEIGTHEELIQLKGQYYVMFNRQKSSYQ
jgi:ATP-binding cassette subfamily B protein